MQYEAEPDRAVAVADPAEEDAGDDGGERLRHWLLKMDHRVRHRHHEDRVNAERRFQAVNEKPAKEEFEPEELQEIDGFPREQRRR